jgi:hypothetical protein
MVRILISALPVLTVLVVAVLAFGVGAPRPISSARVWGGASTELSRFSGWVEVKSESRARHVRISARSEHGERASAGVELDADRRAEFVLDFAKPPGDFALELWLGDRTLGDGRVASAPERWAAARRRGGFTAARSQGALVIAAAPQCGVFAVPFPGPLLLRVERAGLPAAGATLTLSSDSATLANERVKTDSRGIATSVLTPREHVVTLRVIAETADGARGELYTSLPVVPGAMLAERHGDELVIMAPGERDHADVALVSEAGRLFGARVALSSYSDGARGVLRLPKLGDPPLWAVVQSDASAPSPSSLGWPLFDSPSAPTPTFDAVDIVLLDTEPRALAAERSRRRDVQRAALVIGLIGAVASVVALLTSTVLARRTSASKLDAELGSEVSAGVLPRQSWRSLVAIISIILGFFMIVGLLTWRLG